MANLVNVLPFAVNALNLPVIPAADLKRLTNLEIGAYDHWIFNAGSSTGLTGKLSGKALTVQSTAPTYAGSYLTISADQGKALLTDLGESAGQADTIAMVCKINALPTSGAVVLSGTLGPSSGETPPLGGGSLYINSAGGALFLNNRGLYSPDTTETAAADTWMFVCVSRNLVSGGYVRMLKGGSATVREYTGDYSVYVPAPSPRKLALGGAYYNNRVGHTLSIFEAVIFNRGLTAAEMQALYLRAKARAAAAGITV